MLEEDHTLEGQIHKQNSQLSSVVQIGRIIEWVQEDPQQPTDGIPRVLVQVGGKEAGSYSRNWMPWVTTRAGYDTEWWRPELDEQVLVLAPSGNLGQGVIAGTLYRGILSFDKKDGGEPGEIEHRDPIPAEDKQHLYQRIYQDGTRMTYDRKDHQLAVLLKQTPKDKAPLVSLTAQLTDNKGKLNLLLGTEDDPQVKIIADAAQAGELQIIAAQKTTLIAGSVDNPKVKILADAGTGVEVTTAGNITLSAGKTVITVNQNGTVDIAAGSNNITTTAGDITTTADNITTTADNITIAGNVKVTGTLDVS